MNATGPYDGISPGTGLMPSVNEPLSGPKKTFVYVAKLRTGDAYMRQY